MQKQAPKLVIMAAGMGSRFGGLKQMEPVDREGHSIIDFSMYDARRAGFRDLVFIIKREHEALFRERIGTRMERFFHVEYVYQELTDIPAGYSVPDGRVKPWGTGQAVACCRNVLHGPFAVINSDDFYGRTAFSMIYEFLRTNDDEHCYAMVGYRVRNTVTEFGSVARGVCEVENGMLTSITERMQIYQRGDHAAYTEDGTQFVDLPGDTIVSMNLWGFTQPMVSELWSRLSTFLAQQVPQNPMKCEFYLPNAVNQQLEDGTAHPNLPDEDAERQMYWDTETLMEKNGYHRYEISNYAKEGYACRHNLGYWERIPYLGFGIGAASLVPGDLIGKCRKLEGKMSRYTNPDQLREYAHSYRNKFQAELLTEIEEMEEFMFLGLRKMNGISKKEFSEYFGKSLEDIYGEPICKLESLKLLEQDDDRVWLTKRGIDVSNSVFVEFLLEE